MFRSLELDYIDLTDLIPIPVGDFGAVAQASAGQYVEGLTTEGHCGGTTTVFRCVNLRRVCCVLQSERRRAIIHRSYGHLDLAEAQTTLSDSSLA